MAAACEVSVKVVPDLSAFAAETAAGILSIDVMADTKAKVDAGAALTFALYHAGPDALDWIKSMPPGVARAYARASSAFACSSWPRSE